jgi:hypothetical protein
MKCRSKNIIGVIKSKMKWTGRVVLWQPRQVFIRRPKIKKQLGSTDVYWRIILKCIYKKRDEGAGTG